MGAGWYVLGFYHNLVGSVGWGAAIRGDLVELGLVESPPS